MIEGIRLLLSQKVSEGFDLLFVCDGCQISSSKICYEIFGYQMVCVIILEQFLICDQASENRPCGHIYIFEKYHFEIFNAT